MVKSKGSRLLRIIDVFIRRRLGPTSVPSGDGLHYWRERIFHYFSIGLLFLGLIVFLYLLLTFIQEESYTNAIVTSFVFISAVLVISTKAIPFKFRVSWILFLIYLVGTFQLLISNSSPIGFMFLLSYTLMAGILSSQKSALFAVSLSTITLAFLSVALYLPAILMLCNSQAFMCVAFQHSLNIAIVI